MKNGQAVKNCEYCKIVSGTLRCYESPSLMNFLTINLDIKVFTVPNPLYFDANGDSTVEVLTYAKKTEKNFQSILNGIEEILSERFANPSQIYLYTISNSLIRCKII